MNKDLIKQRVYQQGRDIEVAQYNYFFEKDDNESVPIALSLYQNEDGGFGGDLEPDSMNPNSSPFQTSVALEILTDVGFRSNNLDEFTEDMVLKATEYLIEILDNDIWGITIPSNDEHSCAPWWRHREVQSEINPTASILASLLLLLNIGDIFTNSIEFLSRNLLETYLEIDVEDKHELACLIRLHQAIRELGILEDLEPRIYDKLKEDIGKSISPIDKWTSGYVNFPFDYPIYNETYGLNESLIKENIKHLEKTLVRDHWNINWEWGNDDPAFEMQAIKWQSILAIKNLRFLQKFQK